MAPDPVFDRRVDHSSGRESRSFRSGVSAALEVRASIDHL
jgi:hypothetical protein